MESQIKDNFIPNIGIGKLRFLDNELTIKEKIGVPNYEKKDTKNNKDYTLHLSYEDLGIDCFVHYEDSFFSYTSFHLQSLTINNIDLINMTEKECVNFLKDYHLNLNIKYVMHMTNDDEKILFFENIGLTIWFSMCNITDLSIEPIW